jgi:hypothetical protein
MRAFGVRSLAIACGKINMRLSQSTIFGLSIHQPLLL